MKRKKEEGGKEEGGRRKGGRKKELTCGWCGERRRSGGVSRQGAEAGTWRGRGGRGLEGRGGRGDRGGVGRGEPAREAVEVEGGQEFAALG
jgi:hypothetical protein